ncbi:MAG: glutaredoxin family protein [Methylobacter sp.]|nr:glutaredoxin family protein [Methylobacter sp.]MDP2099490.1 glutaredoxin family protein [Methylobacter sp.]MDP2429730.1 glutaredoxin family protein [Methylobacter sp.]MDP3054348.1 glutaredoxin family protein [Methylobacter sp.]MDP3361004.1 glutaredoxin family protein [Methylobacter sp.]
MRLILFGTSACHLCEQADIILHECLQDGVDWVVDAVDIAEQSQWQELYALRIPVLYDPETGRELGWPFDAALVKDFLQ